MKSYMFHMKFDINITFVGNSYELYMKHMEFKHVSYESRVNVTIAIIYC